MHLGKAVEAAAASERSLGPEARAAIRIALAPIADAIRHDMTLVLDALGGPDPECALYLFVEVLHGLPAAARDLEGAIAPGHHLRRAA